MPIPELPRQSLAAKRAESRRPFHGPSILEQDDLGRLHRERAGALLADLRRFAPVLGSLDPFLELGAGSVQRSIALMNAHDVDGVATDISSRSLRDAEYVLTLLGAQRMPMLVSCDSQYLPFLSDSFQFVFAYQTLHHFENPVPVFAEAHRVLGKGGLLLFNEEPMDSPLRRRLRGSRLLTVPRTRWQRLGERLGVEKLFWDDGASERAEGMTEARFDVDLWRTCLEPFEIVDLEINRKVKLRPDLRAPGPRTWLAGLLGGNVMGLCRKTDGEPASHDLRSRLMCVDCGGAPLASTPRGLACERCRREYPAPDGIARLLPRDLDVALYPGEHALTAI